MKKHKKRFAEEYFCPNCNASFNSQNGFDPSIGVWKCTSCGTVVFGEDIENTTNSFSDVVWYCDSCGAVLNKQPGFFDSCGTWYCSKCGHANPINKNEIFESEEDYQNRQFILYKCPHCNEILNFQAWFDEREENYTCTKCGTQLYKDADKYKVLFKCPNCGEDLKEQWGFNEDSYWTCRHCNSQLHKNGTQYSILNDSSNDEDNVDDSTTSSSYGYYSNKGESYVKPKKSHWKIKLVLILIFIILMMIGVGYYEYTMLIPVKYSKDKLIGEQYLSIVECFKDAGFSHVHTENIEDLEIQNSTADYQVTDVKIGWISSFNESTKLPSNFPVTVTYHSLKKILVPMSSKEARGSNYEEVVNAFEKAGFNNVDVEIEYDIITGWLAEDGEVKSVRIGETSNFSDEDKFRPDEPIVITYHTLMDNKPDK